ncbi:hypothetical protein X773_33335 [Mesorhizobium sp. LSJC285A00]|nr:hypothetical protein X773_33335 [Mesorhizobium sp. LSJC285A00]
MEGFGQGHVGAATAAPIDVGVSSDPLDCAGEDRQLAPRPQCRRRASSLDEH